jgi:nitroreductase
MTELLALDADQLLSTTRAVRKRLDFDRPVPDEVVLECLRMAQQAPSGSNNPTMQFVVIRDQAKKAAVGELYGQAFARYKTLDGIYIGSIDKHDEAANATQRRSASSADLLGERMGEAPVLVIACTAGARLDNVPAMAAASMLGNILPATWSFMLAARARGLGTCWTTLHLMKEREVADILGIPFDTVQQVCLTPLAYTKGTDFKPAPRPPVETIVHWDTW